MKLSVRGEYALRALIVLGLNYDRAVVPIQTIARLQNIPRKFLEQILNELRAGGILESRRGVAGGYRLARPPEKITLAEVIRYIEGPLAPVSCVSERFYERCTCPDENNCGIRSVMKEVRDAIVKILEAVTLAQLCERVRKLQGDHANPLDYVIQHYNLQLSGLGYLPQSAFADEQGILYSFVPTRSPHPVVLVAEDNQADVFMLERAFAQLGFICPVQYVGNGEEAIAYLSGRGRFANRSEYPLPDLLLLDLKMPRKNGFEVLEWLRTQRTLSRLRTVVLTTSELIYEVDRAYQLGAASFLTKPVIFNEFKDTIQAVYNYWLTMNKAPTVDRPSQEQRKGESDGNK